MALRFCRHFQSLSCSFQRLKLINKKTWFARKNHISAQDAREISVPLPYGSIAGKEWGNMNGYPILCLHGFADNCDSFAPVAPLLSPNFHYIALDAVGHGLSSHPPLGTISNFWDLVIFVRRAVEHLKLPKVSILGHSMGGSTGLLYASLYPEKVERLLLLDIVKPVTLPLAWHTQSISEAIDQQLELERRMTNPKLERSFTIEELVNRYVEYMQGTITPEAVRLLMKRGSKSSGTGFVYTHDSRMMVATVLRFTVAEQRKIIKGLKCHLKIIKAKQGPLYEAAELIEEFKQYYEKQCASYEYDKTLEGTHHFHMHNPEAVAPIINEYFSRLNV